MFQNTSEKQSLFSTAPPILSMMKTDRICTSIFILHGRIYEQLYHTKGIYIYTQIEHTMQKTNQEKVSMLANLESKK